MEKENGLVRHISFDSSKKKQTVEAIVNIVVGIVAAIAIPQFAYTRFPFKYLDEFRQLERKARDQGRRLWGRGPYVRECLTLFFECSAAFRVHQCEKKGRYSEDIKYRLGNFATIPRYVDNG